MNLVLSKLADTVLISINMDPSNVKVTKRLQIGFVPILSIMKLLLMLSVLNIDDGTLVKHYFLMVALIFYTKSHPFHNVFSTYHSDGKFLIKLT